MGRSPVTSGSAFLPEADISKRHLLNHGGATVFGWEWYPKREKCRVVTDKCFWPSSEALAGAAAPAPRLVDRLVRGPGGGRAVAGGDDRPAPRGDPEHRERLWPLRGCADDR